MGLRPPTAQQDFSAGMVRLAPHLLPQNSAWNLENMLLDDDGSAYKRGGTVALSNAVFDDGLTFLWDGELAGGQRTVFASSASLGTLDIDGVTPIDFAFGGIASPVRPAAIDGILFAGAYAYAGSRKTATYNAGTVTVTLDDETVVGAGTAWLANVDPGMLLLIGTRLMAVRSVTDNTHLELVKPWPGATAAGQAYTAKAVQAIPSTYHPNSIYGVAGGRLLSADGTRIYESAGGDSSTWDVTEYHELPSGDVPAAIEGLGDVAFVMATGGVWSISNVPFDLTDDIGNPQQVLQRVSGDVVLWEAAGVAFWENQLVIPALDGVWLFGRGEPELLTRSIVPLYGEFLTAGYSCGLADVFHGQYHLPILDASGDNVTTLVCRLDRPVRLPRVGTIYPWTALAGAGADVTAFAARVTQPPMLLAAETAGSCRVLRMGNFTPDGAPLDHNGSTVETEVVSRDFATGPLNVNFVKFLRIRYELLSDDGTATITGEFGTDARPAGNVWGGFNWGESTWVDVELEDLVGEAPENDGDDPYTWSVNRDTRYFRCRLRTADPANRYVLRSLEVFVRPSGRM